MNKPVHTDKSEEQHRQDMQALQAEMRKKLSAAKEKHGLIMVHTGNGKGKSTAAFGMVARMLAHGRKVGVVQFIKATPDAIEKVLRGPNLTWRAVGDGFTWDTQDRAGDIAKVREGWKYACEFFEDPNVALVMLDELNVVLSMNYLPVEEVIAALKAKRPELHVVITGRGAPQELVNVADLVTEMREIKHPFNAGIKAQLGIEF
ncbi:MAG: cob(I)yrinic acid a,c-diamide adenosyltransferase [Nibricoccus sp.]